MLQIVKKSEVSFGKVHHLQTHDSTTFDILRLMHSCIFKCGIKYPNTWMLNDSLSLWIHWVHLASGWTLKKQNPWNTWELICFSTCLDCPKRPWPYSGLADLFNNSIKNSSGLDQCCDQDSLTSCSALCF